MRERMSKIYGKKTINTKVIRSYWPDWVRRLFETLREIPWVSLTAISTLAGVLILFLYFQSINYFPSDFAALVSLGAATAICAIGVVVVLSLGLFAPAAVYSHYSSDELPLGHPISLTQFQLVALQLGGVGGVFISIAYPLYRDCDVIFNHYGTIGIVLIGIGLVAWVKLLIPKGPLGSYVARSWAALSLTLLGLTPALIAAPFRSYLSIQKLVLALFFSPSGYLQFWLMLPLATSFALQVQFCLACYWFFYFI
jgi:hypothetical protein